MRLALIVHPSRPIDEPLRLLRLWAEKHGVEVVQIESPGGTERELARHADLERGDLVIALGGDGTVLSALRAAASGQTPVLAVACGSLGAMAAVHADRIEEALERFREGDWVPRPLPALAIQPAKSADQWAVNDFVIVRHGSGQAVVDLYLDDELYVRVAGDGLIVATPIGSSAYSMAAGGPLLAPDTPAFVCTPLAMHGGSAPPLVVPATSSVRVEIQHSFAGFDIEIDGHAYPIEDVDYRVSLVEERVSLVAFGEGGASLTGLRKRGLIADSPRVLARRHRGG
jgi:NAD+ kinase